MGQIKPVEPVKLICGIIATNADGLRCARREMEAFCGPADGQSAVVPFSFTDYYREEMGEGLLRTFLSFETLIDPGQLVAIKRTTQILEERLGERCAGVLRRRVNLDPGYVTPSRLVLATTKDYAHRIYLGEGIYGEVTLLFRRSRCTFFPWTYPDYRSEIFIPFFLDMRRRLLQTRRSSRRGKGAGSTHAWHGSFPDFGACRRAKSEPGEGWPFS